MKSAKKQRRIFSKTLFVTAMTVFAFSVPFFVSAQSTVASPQTTPIPPDVNQTPSTQVIIPAVVEDGLRIDNVVFSVKEKNSVDIAFELNNSSSAQIDVLFTIELVAKDKAGINRIIDANTHREMISIAPKSGAKQAVTYEAPFFANGEYELYLAVKTTAGFPVANALIGGVTFKGAIAPVTLESCEHPDSGKGLSMIEVGDTAVLSCVLINGTKIVQKTELMGELALWGRSEAVQKTSMEITLDPLERRVVVFTMPPLTQPGRYDGIAFLSNDGRRASPPINFAVQVNGASGIISDIRLDKDYYKAGDVATILVYVQTSLKNNDDSDHLQIAVSMENGKGSFCATITSKEIGNGKVTLDMPIERECTDPRVLATISTRDGVILDEQRLMMRSPISDKKQAFPQGAVFGGIILLLLVLSFIVYRNLNKKEGSFHFISFLLLPIALSLFLHPNIASAATLSGVISFGVDNITIMGAGNRIDFYSGTVGYVGSINISSIAVGVSVTGSASMDSDNFVINGSGNSIDLYHGNSLTLGGNLMVSGGTVSGSISCNTDGWGVYGSGDQMVVSCNGPGGAITFYESCAPFGVVIPGNGGTLAYYDVSSAVSCPAHQGTFTCNNGILNTDITGCTGVYPQCGPFYQFCSVVVPTVNLYFSQ